MLQALFNLILYLLRINLGRTSQIQDNINKFTLKTREIKVLPKPDVLSLINKVLLNLNQ